MSKAIRWQIPFADINGNHYRVDIYDEADGTWSAVTTLQAGDNPLTSSEDDSENYYTPVRVQTGTISINTELSDGTRITLEELLPKSNLLRPVQVVNITAGNVVEWQGFLSSEAYSQPYNAIPTNIELPIISVLEAMDSVEIKLNEDMAFAYILDHIAYILYMVEQECGMSVFGDIYFPAHCYTVLINDYIYNNVYFEAREIVSGDNIIVETHSLSCKEILSRIAAFFGCTWREQGQNLYMSLPEKVDAYTYWGVAYLIDNCIIHSGSVPTRKGDGYPSVALLSELAWMGINHKRDFRQGAKRVTVETNLKDFSASLNLQDTPVGSLVVNPQSRWQEYAEVQCNTNETYYSLATHRHMRLSAIFPSNYSGATLNFLAQESAIMYAQTIFWANNDFRTYYVDLVNRQTRTAASGITYYVTSYMSYLRTNDGLVSGLMICGVPKYLTYSINPVQGRTWNKFALTAYNYLYKLATPLMFAASSGYIRININTLSWWDASGHKFTPYVYEVYNPALTIAVSFGSKWLKYANGEYIWSDTFATIDYQFGADGKPISNWTEDMGIEEGEGLYISIPEIMVGFVSVYLYHEINAINAGDFYTSTTPAFDVFISKLDVDYLKPAGELLTDRNSNVYMSNTGHAYRDEITVTLNMATNAANSKLATMLWTDSVTPATKVLFTDYYARPEADLLERLRAYYSEVRQQLTLEAAHPVVAPLPLIRFSGIADGKTYTAVCGQREWRTGICRLICMENP